MIKSLVNKFGLLAQQLPQELLALVARFSIATVFWKSAQTKISGGEFLGQKWQFYNVSDSTFSLFEYEYELPVIPYDIAAYMATYAEFFLALTIAFGLFTRFSALALVGMTAVIQFLVYPDAWPVHILWLMPLLYLLKHGGGQLSLDKLFNLDSIK